MPLPFKGESVGPILAAKPISQKLARDELGLLQIGEDSTES